MSYVFSPGCALMIYKPALAKRVEDCLTDSGLSEGLHLTCCHHDPGQPKGTVIINTCAGCDRRFRQLYEEVDTISLWEVLAESETFPFPDYGGMEMAVLDACPTRDRPGVHDAVRTLMKRMNITIREPEKTREKGTCCGDSYYPALPVEEVNKKMKERTAEMPAENVCVYCVSCVKSIYIGGKTPRYLVDLLFGEETHPGTYETDKWHAEVDAFIKEH